jgi:hypothetical protein
MSNSVIGLQGRRPALSLATMSDLENDAIARKINASVEAQESRSDLFTAKVSVIGELHTERATWANKLGELKSQAMINSGDIKEDFKVRVADIEKTLSKISSDITAFSPASTDELEKFRGAIKERFAALESLYKKAYAIESEHLPDDLEME